MPAIYAGGIHVSALLTPLDSAVSMRDRERLGPCSSGSAHELSPFVTAHASRPSLSREDVPSRLHRDARFVAIGDDASHHERE